MRERMKEQTLLTALVSCLPCVLLLHFQSSQHFTGDETEGIQPLVCLQLCLCWLPRVGFLRVTLTEGRALSVQRRGTPGHPHPLICASLYLTQPPPPPPLPWGPSQGCAPF